MRTLLAVVIAMVLAGTAMADGVIERSGSAGPRSDAPPGALRSSIDPVAELPAAPVGKLVVGVLPGDGAFAPFVMKSSDGTWGGIAVDLWKEVARRLKLDYELREMSIADIHDPAKLGQVDVFLSWNVSAEHEAQLDLSHAFYSTGNAIAVAPKPDDGFAATLKAIFTPKFGRLIAALMGILLITGVLMWLAERGRNDQFGGSAAHGIGAGLWWSAVTMTTVGYGDKAPVTFAGRALGLVWMFAAILIIASFTASIASALTVNQLGSAVSGPADLPKVKCGSVDTGAGKAYLQRRQIPFKTYKDRAAEVDALARGEVDAVVDEAPLLQYEVGKRGDDAGLVVLDGTFDNHGYALALKRGSPLRKAVNLAMLQFVQTEEWTALVARYLGR
jgi:ABC-type amino acid transport substrate-binding protein